MNWRVSTYYVAPVLIAHHPDGVDNWMSYGDVLSAVTDEPTSVSGLASVPSDVS